MSVTHMNRIPFGVSQFDSLVGGDSPPGSVVLLAGDAGAGAREFAYTSARINDLGNADSTLFDLHYGTVDSRASLPDEIQYISFTASAQEIYGEVTHTIDEELVSSATETIEFEDLSTEYFQLSPIPHDWYVKKRRTITDLGKSHSRRDILEALGEYLTEHASDSLVIIDSLTDLVSLPDEQVEWHEIPMLLKGMKKATQSWGGLILVLLDQESLTSTQMGRTDGCDGRYHQLRVGTRRQRTRQNHVRSRVPWCPLAHRSGGYPPLRNRDSGRRVGYQ